MLFKIPFIGFMTGFIRTKLGWFLAILIPSALLVGFLIKDYPQQVHFSVPLGNILVRFISPLYPHSLD
jgi:hypothetical protein